MMATVMGSTVVFLGLLCHWLLISPVASFLDPRWPGLVLVSAGFLILAHSWLSPRRRSPAAVGVFVGAFLASSLLLAGDFFDHRELEIHFTNGNVELSGTLFEPRSPGPHPCVILMHGSSPGTRGIFRPIANALLRRGIASLAYDKRGFGDSEGQLPYTYGQLADDALAGLGAIRTRPEIDSGRIGLMGFSEGGWTAPLAASRSAGRVAYMVVVSGGALSPADQGLWEMRTRLKDRGFDTGSIRKALSLQGALNDYYRTGRNGDRLAERIQAVKESAWFQTGFELSPDQVPASLDDVEYAHDPSELDFDAVSLLTRLDLPILFVFGGADRTVPPRRSIRILRAALGVDEDPDVRIEVFPDADHLLLQRTLGGSLPWPRFAPGYLESVADWIVELDSRKGAESSGARSLPPAPSR